MKLIKKFSLLFLSMALVLSTAVFSSSAALLQNGTVNITVNGVTYSCDGKLYSSGTSLYCTSRTDASTYRAYNYNSITYLTTNQGYISKYLGSTGTGSMVSGLNTSSTQKCPVSGASSISGWNVTITFARSSSNQKTVTLKR